MMAPVVSVVFWHENGTAVVLDPPAYHIFRRPMLFFGEWDIKQIDHTANNNVIILCLYAPLSVSSDVNSVGSVQYFSTPGIALQLLTQGHLGEREAGTRYSRRPPQW